MTKQEFKEELSNYMKEGEFIVNDAGNEHIHIIWTVDRNESSAVIESKLLKMEPENFVEEVVKPLVMKFKKLKVSFRDTMKQATEEYKVALEYLKDK